MIQHLTNSGTMDPHILRLWLKQKTMIRKLFLATCDLEIKESRSLLQEIGIKEQLLWILTIPSTCTAWVGPPIIKSRVPFKHLGKLFWEVLYNKQDTQTHILGTVHQQGCLPAFHKRDLLAKPAILEVKQVLTPPL